MRIRELILMLFWLCSVFCTAGCYRAAPPLEDDQLEQIESGTDTTQNKPTPTPVAGPATPNNSPLIMQIADLEIDELSTYPTLAFRIFDFDDEVKCANVIPESNNQNAIQTTAEGEPNESAMTYGDITITGGDSTKCGIAISTRYAAPDPVTVSLTLSDGKGATKSYFDVSVLSTNTAPTGAGGQASVSLNEDDSGTSVLLPQFSDATPRGSPARLEFQSVTNPKKGVLGLWPSDAAALGQSITYTPNENENGPDSFSYKVCDNDPGVAMCSPVQTISISIAADNDPPKIDSIDSQTTIENQSKAFTFTISDVDSVVSCSNISYTFTSTVANLLPSSGGVVFSGNGKPNCSATITPTPGKSGSATITFTLSDGSKEGSQSFAFNVNGINHAPTISNISDLTATEDTPFDISFTVADEDGDLACNSTYLSYESKDTSKIAANNAVTWSGTWPNCIGRVTPVSNAFGTVELKFNITDTEYTSTDAFNINLQNVNDPPSGVVKCKNASSSVFSTSDLFIVGRNGAAWTVNCNNATDPDAEPLTYKLTKQSETDLSGVVCSETITSTPVNASEVKFSGNFASTPNYGTCTYKVKACDAAGECTALSSFEIDITSYQLSASQLNKPTLNTSCVASSAAAFTFSSNISTLNYNAKTGINNETGQSGATNTSPVTFSYSLPNDYLTTSRFKDEEQSGLSARFDITSGAFKNSVGGGTGILASAASATFKVTRKLEAVSPRLPSNFTTEQVNLDGYQSSFETTSAACRQCVSNRISLSTASNHTCVIAENSKLKCSGENSDSQLGTGNSTDYNYPKDATAGAFSALQVSTGKNFTCLYGLNAAVPQIRCAGSNSQGQLGRAGSSYTKFDSSSMTVNSPSNHVPIAVTAAKFGEFACGLFNDQSGSGTTGKIYCWGRNDSGQLGNNSTTTPTSGTLVPPAGVQGNSGFFSLSAGENHTCAIQKLSPTSSKVYCWGAGGNGKLGHNSNNSSSTPVEVDSTLMGTSVAQVVTGQSHSCALTTDGKVYCWGDNSLGQLGLGDTTSSSAPQHVSSTNIDNKVVQLSAGAYHTCALLNSFELYCWGFGSSGQLGLGSSTTSDGSADDCNASAGVQNVAYCKKYPAKITFSGSPTLVSVSAGAEHTCAVSLEGNGYCWGRNADGRLGISTNTDISSPSNICSSAVNCTALTTLRPQMCSTYSIP